MSFSSFHVLVRVAGPGPGDLVESPMALGLSAVHCRSFVSSNSNTRSARPACRGGRFAAGWRSRPRQVP